MWFRLPAKTDQTKKEKNQDWFNLVKSKNPGVKGEE